MEDRGYVDARIADLRHELDARFEAVEHEGEVWRAQLGGRLDGMDKDRDTLRAQAADRVTRIEHEEFGRRISRLESTSARYAGALVLVGVLLGMVPLLVRVLGQ